MHSWLFILVSGLYSVHRSVYFDTLVTPDLTCDGPVKQTALSVVSPDPSLCLDSEAPRLLPSVGTLPPTPNAGTLNPQARTVPWVDALLTLVAGFFMLILGVSTL